MKRKIYKTAEAALAAVEKLRRKQERFAIVTVLHDAECTPQACSCRRHYVVEAATKARVGAAVRREREWIEQCRKAMN